MGRGGDIAGHLFGVMGKGRTALLQSGFDRLSLSAF